MVKRGREQLKEVFHHDGVMSVGWCVVGGCGGRGEVWVKRKQRRKKKSIKISREK